MEESKVSKMALGTAYQRGYHAAHDAPKVFDDFLANQLLPDEERVSSDQQILAYVKFKDPALAASFPDQAAALAWIMQNWTGLSTTVSPYVLKWQ